MALATIALVVAPGGYIGWRCTFLAVAMWLYLYTLALPGSGPVRVHSHRWLVYWGEVSYALYLSHGVVIRVVKAVLGSEKYANSGVLVRVGWVGLALGLTVLAAMALHHGVEEPARKWLRRLGPKSAARVTA